jgi:hypothetical protein
VVDGMRDAGFSEEQIRRAQEMSSPEQVCEVFPENWNSVLLLRKTSTQWHRDAMGHITGLDYGAVREVMQLTSIARHRWRRLFSDIQTMEMAALEVFKQKHADKA